MLMPWPPTTPITASMFFSFQFRQQLVGHVHFLDHFEFVELADVEGIHPGGLAQDAASRWIEVFHDWAIQLHQAAIGIKLRLEQAGESIPDSDDLPTCRAAAMAAPLMTPLIPGTKPAPTMMAMRLLFIFICLIGV